MLTDEAQKFLQDDSPGYSIKVVLQYFLERGAHIKKVFSIPKSKTAKGKSSVGYVIVLYHGIEIPMRSDDDNFFSILNSVFARSITVSKVATAQFLDLHDIQTPSAVLYKNHQQAEDFLKSQKTLVVKPNSGSRGKGVSLDIRSETALKQAINDAKKHTRDILLQRHVSGKDYRLLFVNYELVAAILRTPPYVVGDGRSSVEQLIRRENRSRIQRAKRRPTTIFSSWQTAKVFTISLEEVLRENGRGFLNKIPAEGKKIQVLKKANISLGGLATDVTDEVNKELISKYSNFMRSVDLPLCGVDVISEGISAPLSAGKSWIIEINSSPGFFSHIWPDVGQKRDVGAIVAEAIYQKQKTLQNQR